MGKKSKLKHLITGTIIATQASQIQACHPFMTPTTNKLKG